MKTSNLLRFPVLAMLLAPMLAVAAVREPHPGAREFAAEVAAEAGDRADRSERAVLEILSRARYQQGIIDAMTRPAEAKPWRDYRPIFLNDKRIRDGVAFWRTHAGLLEPIAQQYGVPPELIVAIIGVETAYGGNVGRWKVLDALATLAFHYPKRAPYFRGELKRILLLPEGTFPKPLDELVGSYAGAMGLGQFMPTSYANWAVDQDADGMIDLWSDYADVFASVANYFIAHEWQPGQPVAHPARRGDGARTLSPEGFLPVYTVGQLAEWGYTTEFTLDPELPATLIRLDGETGDEYWITHQNFYSITRYNRSPLYSLAVFQLAGRIAEDYHVGAVP